MNDVWEMYHLELRGKHEKGKRTKNIHLCLLVLT